MEAELASDAEAGPVSMDLRASVKANNDKFFTAIREMRKNLGISVYDLPWYIVIGDSGCGKTKLINEGGLTFSTGKPEGYQLGTLNYNWWFTEDAIFVDMAGRLCNPQDDADRREWTAFLRHGRPRAAAVTRSTARWCASRPSTCCRTPRRSTSRTPTRCWSGCATCRASCGVTFATYLVVTKCDKILGFMQFFDRAERDITIKNQIFGWSKPGRFQRAVRPRAVRPGLRPALPAGSTSCACGGSTTTPTRSSWGWRTASPRNSGSSAIRCRSTSARCFR